jgi:hypothetical protein
MARRLGQTQKRALWGQALAILEVENDWLANGYDRRCGGEWMLFNLITNRRPPINARI